MLLPLLIVSAACNAADKTPAPKQGKSGAPTVPQVDAKQPQGEEEAQILLALRDARARGFNTSLAAIKVLAQAKPEEYPGIVQFVVDYDAAATLGESRRDPNEPMQLEAVSLTTQNPNFWRAYLEVEPGDPIINAAYAGMLMSEGLINHVPYIYLLIVCSDIDPNLRQAMIEQLNSANGVIEAAGPLIDQGMKLIDAGNAAASLEYFQRVLNVWPQSSMAEYEIGLSLMTMQEERAKYEAHYIRSREFGPFQTFAYQGDAAQATQAILPLMETIHPAFEEMQHERKHSVQSLEKLSDACMKVPIPAFAIVSRMFLIAHRGEIVESDYVLIESALTLLLTADDAAEIVTAFRNRTIAPFPLTQRISEEMKKPKRSA